MYYYEKRKTKFYLLTEKLKSLQKTLFTKYFYSLKISKPISDSHRIKIELNKKCK